MANKNKRVKINNKLTVVIHPDYYGEKVYEFQNTANKETMFIKATTMKKVYAKLGQATKEHTSE